MSASPELVALKTDAAGRLFAEARIVGWQSDPIGRMFGDPGNCRHYRLADLDDRERQFIARFAPSREESCVFLEGGGPCVLLWDDQRPSWWPA